MKNRIKELREQRGLTQEQLGELVGSFKAGDKCHRNRKIRTIYLACI